MPVRVDIDINFKKGRLQELEELLKLNFDGTFIVLDKEDQSYIVFETEDIKYNSSKENQLDFIRD